MSALGTGMFHDALRLPSSGESGTDAAGRRDGAASRPARAPDGRTAPAPAGAAMLDWLAVTNTRRKPSRSFTSGTAPL